MPKIWVLSNHAELKTVLRRKFHIISRVIKSSVQLCVVIAFESNCVQKNYLRGLFSALVNLCPKFGYRVTTVS